MLTENSSLFTGKEKRSFERLHAQLFGKKMLTQPTIKELESDDSNVPILNYVISKVWISTDCKKILTSLTKLFSDKFTDDLYDSDIISTIEAVYKHHIKNQTIPKSAQFNEEITSRLDGQIDDITFVAEVEGLIFKDIDFLNFDGAVLRKFHEGLLDYQHQDDELGDLLKNKVLEDLCNKLVFVATVRGSKAVAKDKFEHKAKLDLSILKVFICSKIKQGFFNTHISLRYNKSVAFQDSSLIGWSKGGGLFFSRSASPKRDFPLSEKYLEEFNAEQLFAKLTCLIGKQQKNELEFAVEKSLYWFGEAQTDACYASAFLKLWSSLECFFSITTDEITEKNARGIASVFLYGDINMQLNDVHEFKSYSSLKAMIKRFYILRSALAHRAEHKKISRNDTALLSYIVCNIILSVTCLSYRGYDSLKRLADESERLDQMAKVDNG